MEICSRFTGMERKNGAFLLHTDNADIKVCFVTDEIVRVRASFDHELAEEPYVLMTTAWEDRIKLLPDAALYRSTLIHHTLQFYAKRELVGAGPLHLACGKTVPSLKVPAGDFIVPLRSTNANLSGMTRREFLGLFPVRVPCPDTVKKATAPAQQNGKFALFAPFCPGTLAFCAKLW